MTRLVQTLNRKTSLPQVTHNIMQEMRLTGRAWDTVSSRQPEWVEMWGTPESPSFSICLFLYTSRPVGQSVSLSVHLYSSKCHLCSNRKFGEAFSKFLRERYAKGPDSWPGLVCDHYSRVKFVCTWDCAICFQSALGHGVFYRQGRRCAVRRRSFQQRKVLQLILLASLLKLRFLLCQEEEESWPSEASW